MQKKWFITVIVFLFNAGLLNTVTAQVNPDQINKKLLSKSIAAVTGSGASPEWEPHLLTPDQQKTIEQDLKQLRTIPDSIYVGRLESEGDTLYIMPDIAPSKSKTFSYLLYLDQKSRIVDVDILKYRENYGYEIDYSYFRQQFHGKENPGEIVFGRSIQNISGATISARSITHAVHDLMVIFKQLEIR